MAFEAIARGHPTPVTQPISPNVATKFPARATPQRQSKLEGGLLMLLFVDA